MVLIDLLYDLCVIYRQERKIVKVDEIPETCPSVGSTSLPPIDSGWVGSITPFSTSGLADTLHSTLLQLTENQHHTYS